MAANHQRLFQPNVPCPDKSPRCRLENKPGTEKMDGMPRLGIASVLAGFPDREPREVDILLDWPHSGVQEINAGSTFGIYSIFQKNAVLA
ncbi:hypothetical protein [Mesorhizobium shangrilense]|uniref:Uncharacterized protein n=1 Tax=Mesorhizobium shangrilense TaxID=460060 RepID=A0ABV2DIF3_9HYPH